MRGVKKSSKHYRNARAKLSRPRGEIVGGCGGQSDDPWERLRANFTGRKSPGYLREPAIQILSVRNLDVTPA
jgi:hypothetical protein